MCDFLFVTKLIYVLSCLKQPNNGHLGSNINKCTMKVIKSDSLSNTFSQMLKCTVNL